MKSHIFSIKARLTVLLLFFTFATYISVSAGSSLSHGDIFTTESYSSDVQESLASKVIRFHVLANSDSEEDQALKMQVKEAVVNYIYNNTLGYTSLEDTRDFLESNCDRIIEIASGIINDNGYDYAVNAGLTYSEFPEKSYGDVTFPEGAYESFTITIGNGDGHNWWCVLYPPLCFVDASTGVLPDSSKELLQEELTDDEYDAICDNTGDDSDGDSNNTENNAVSSETGVADSSDAGSVCIRFKYLTFLNSLFE